MTEVGKDLWRSSKPNPLLKAGQLEWAAQDYVQVGLEYFQGWRLHILSGQWPNCMPFFIYDEPIQTLCFGIPALLSFGTWNIHPALELYIRQSHLKDSGFPEHSHQTLQARLLPNSTYIHIIYPEARAQWLCMATLKHSKCLHFKRKTGNCYLSFYAILEGRQTWYSS